MKLTPKENFLKVMHHEIPESIPVGNMGFKGFNDERTYAIIGPSPLDETHLIPMTEHIDAFGLRWVTNEESMSGLIPDVSNPILKDVTKWRDIIKTPDISGIDWEMQARKDIEASGINLEKEAKMVTIGLMPFQEFVGFMGFAEGLCAMYEEPEYVKELLNWMADQYMPVIKASIEYYKPDAAYLLDDTAARYNPFFSVDMYKEFVKPVYKKLCKPYVEAGIPLQYHNCGRCEDFFDDALEIGIDLTDPCQVENNIPAIKAKYGKKFAICSGVQIDLPKSYPEFDKEAIRQQIREGIDILAAGGGYVAGGGAVKSDGRDVSAINNFIKEEIYYYAQDYYNKH